MEKILNDYLEKIERYLKPLPISERVDIVKEIQSEIFELQEATEKNAKENYGTAGESKRISQSLFGRSDCKGQPLLVGIGFLQSVLITVLQVFPDW